MPKKIITKSRVKVATRVSIRTKVLIIGGVLLFVAAGLQALAFSKGSKSDFIQTIINNRTEKRLEGNYNKRSFLRPKSKNGSSKSLRDRNVSIYSETFPICKYITLKTIVSNQPFTIPEWIHSAIVEDNNGFYSRFETDVVPNIDYDSLTGEIIDVVELNVLSRTEIWDSVIDNILPSSVITNVETQNIIVSGSDWDVQWVISPVSYTRLDGTLFIGNASEAFISGGTIRVIADVTIFDGRKFRLTVETDSLVVRLAPYYNNMGSTQLGRDDVATRSNVLIGQGKEYFGELVSDGRSSAFLNVDDIEGISIMRLSDNGDLSPVTDAVVNGMYNSYLGDNSNVGTLVSANFENLLSTNDYNILMETTSDVLSVLATRWIALEATPYSNSENAYVKWTELEPQQGPRVYFCDDSATRQSTIDPFADPPFRRFENGEIIISNSEVPPPTTPGYGR